VDYASSVPDDFAGGAEGISVNLDAGTASFVLARDDAGAPVVTRNDTLAAIERVAGTDAGDVLVGSKNADELIGNDGPDKLDGREGDDSLSGGADEDLLVGGSGKDMLDGGPGLDEFPPGSGGRHAAHARRRPGEGLLRQGRHSRR
jgi:Ca2+-binding RTX toxin-like protein